MDFATNFSKIAKIYAGCNLTIRLQNILELKMAGFVSLEQSGPVGIAA